jgi:hypothetical protein
MKEDILSRERNYDANCKATAKGYNYHANKAIECNGKFGKKQEKENLERACAAGYDLDVLKAPIEIINEYTPVNHGVKILDFN